MAEYVNEDKPIIFKNETDSDFNVGVGVVFRKSGIYEISVNDKTTTVTKISGRKTGHWIDKTDPEWDGEWDDWQCSCCGSLITSMARNLNGVYLYCPKCGARMEDNDESD